MTTENSELDGLSEEELAALKDDEAETETEEELEEDADLEEDTEEEAEETDEENTEDAEETDDSNEGDDNTEVEDDTEEETTDDAQEEVPAEFQAKYQPDEPEDYDNKMSEFADKKKAIREQYEDGEIDLMEYEEGRDEIEKNVRDLERAKDRYDMAQEQAEQAAMQRWQWEQDRFFNQEENKEYKTNALLGSTFDTAIKQLAGDENNANKSMEWFLKEADKQVKSLFGKGQQEQPTKTSRKQTRANIPPNLGDVPAADIADTSNKDEFAHLEKLDGLALEAALAKMSQADQDRYLLG